jgi:hypothetical protein
LFIKYLSPSWNAKGPKRTAKIERIFQKNKHLRLLLDPSDRIRGQRIFGPGVLGIASFQFLPDFEIGPFPETAEVRRQLDGFETRGKQFHQDRPTTVIDPRRVQEAEALLQPDTDDRRIGALPVLHTDTAAGGGRDM